ncbi:hypothetical protein PINS_up011691 [Pythium insidiosum]|nr:hypothetical protein PINS_up011691 [Pythium insidiosum]
MELTKQRQRQQSTGDAAAPESARQPLMAAVEIVDEHTALLLRKARDSVEALEPQITAVRSFVDDFQQFIQQGSMIDLAVGLILGKSFTAILDSFVVDILTPILSLFSGTVVVIALIPLSLSLFLLSDAWPPSERNLSNFYLVARCPLALATCNSATWATWEQARAAGAITVNYGQFLENLINFLTNALFLYVAIKKGASSHR